MKGPHAGPWECGAYTFLDEETATLHAKVTGRDLSDVPIACNLDRGHSGESHRGRIADAGTHYWTSSTALRTRAARNDSPSSRDDARCDAVGSG